VWAAAVSVGACATTLGVIDTLTPREGNVAQVSAGAVSACAVNRLGDLYCWGEDRGGVLGSSGESCEPGRCDSDRPRLVQVPEFVRSVSVGREHACAVTDSGRLFCWGRNDHGQVGSPEAPSACRDLRGGSVRCQPTPTEVTGERMWREVAAGDLHTCGILSTGEMLCWGEAESGRLGTRESLDGGPQPLPIQSRFGFSSVSADSAYACGVSRDDRMVCWGSVPFNTEDAPSTLPTPFEPLPRHRFQAVEAGFGGVCGITRSGEVICLGGERRWGVPRVPGRTDPYEPPLGPEGARTLISVSMGRDHGCAVGADQVAECWGRNDHGQLGDGSTDAREARGRVMQASFVSISAGEAFTCGVTAEHHLRCWGSNRKGTLARVIGSMERYPVPVRIPGKMPR
jgi:alpha-tubulin suppressor-like RCC1 family protein